MQSHLPQANRFHDNRKTPIAARGVSPAAARKVVLLWFGILASLGAGYRTDNFVVDADHPEVARQIGEAAEKCRKKIACQWLGRELPAWSEPCMLEVRHSADGKRGGYSTFYFDGGRLLGQQLHIKGSLPELLPKVLPHEVTHSILANHFGCPVPRWADEGTAILAEDETEKDRRDTQMLKMLSATDKAYRLASLFDLHHYPQDPRIFYTQSYSITRFLVELADHRTFLKFLNTGMRAGWDCAVRSHYPYENVAQLEEAWKKRLRFTQLTQVLAPLLPPLMQRLRSQSANLEYASIELLYAVAPLAQLPRFRWPGSWPSSPAKNTELATNAVPLLPRAPALGGQ